MQSKTVILAILTFGRFTGIHGFLPTTKTRSAIKIQKQKPFRPTRLASKNSEHDHGKAFDHNMQRTCMQQFLTQRSLQSFMYLLTEVRDVHTCRWIETFLEAPNLLEYHGTGAFNMTRFDSWDSYFVDMMQQPKERYIVQALKRSAAGFRGGSKNNPYLNQEEHHVEVPIDINPSSLVPRILAVREQIAREFVIDLNIAKLYNDGIMISYDEGVSKGRGHSKTAFDRCAMIMLESEMAMARFCPSTLRKGSFDLLLNLSLQEGIHRVLREYKDIGKEKLVSYDWLINHYSTKIEEYFDGYQHRGRADEFIEELLKTAPTIKSTAEGTQFVDTYAITTDILQKRSEVLMEWKTNAMNVPEDHIALNHRVLTTQANRWAEDMAQVESDFVSEDTIGAFE